ncbi:alpha/beta hydrolase [Deinococcus rubellus]|uniref:Alpha/beta hydrolase n=1 Tax=Deinococcus rubellus TaxID=1889240 RepID=A0ABY5YEJ5_9DEIO|nr:alpha/beta hydrolase [Deinococcus rubellus]UWX63509.1 alpha/beta hydrolase [Deinococcus rubellus]
MSGPTPALPLALIHGFGTSGRLWRRVRERLASPTEVLTPDLLGFGNAAALGRDGQMTGDMAEHLAGVLRASGSGPYRLAAHSMGGKVALLLAARHPALVAELLLIAPSPAGPEPMGDEDRAQLRAAWGDPVALEKQYRHISRQPLPEQDLYQLVSDGLRASRDAWEAWTDVGSREDIGGELGTLAVPVTVLFSEDDPAIGPEVIRDEVLAKLAGTQGQPIKGSGHLIPLEVPQSVLTALGE